MTDRFDFLEIGDERPRPVPPAGAAGSNASPGWKSQRLKAVEVIGDPGTGAGQFSAPTGIAVDRWGTLYVADSNNHRVQRIMASGDVAVFGRPGNLDGQLWGPMDVAVDEDAELIVVAEQGNNRVQYFHMLTKQHRGTISGFRSPSGLAMDAERRLWIADTGNSRLLCLDMRTGQFLGRPLDQSVGITRPIAVACDTARNLYVTDSTTQNVTRYAYNGARGMALGDSRRLATPRGIAVDKLGRIYLAEAGANRLHVFDAEGQSLITFESPGSRLGPLNAPSGVALGPNGEIYVADTLNHRILSLAWY